MVLFPICGYAARTGLEFFNVHKNRYEIFARGCFRDVEAQRIVLGVNHSACPRNNGGVVIDRLVFARSNNSTLTLTEDRYGLRLEALVPFDAAIQYDGQQPVNLLEAIADGRCTGLSIHVSGGARWVGPNVPADTLAWSNTNIVEVSLVIGEPPGSPGTWVSLDTKQARQRLAACLRQAEETA